MALVSVTVVITLPSMAFAWVAVVSGLGLGGPGLLPVVVVMANFKMLLLAAVE